MDTTRRDDVTFLFWRRLRKKNDLCCVVLRSPISSSLSRSSEFNAQLNVPAALYVYLANACSNISFVDACCCCVVVVVVVAGSGAEEEDRHSVRQRMTAPSWMLLGSDVWMLRIHVPSSFNTNGKSSMGDA